MKNQPDKSAGKTSSEPLLTLNLLRGRRRGSKKLREIVQKGNKIYTYIYTSCIDINSRICALHYAQFLHFCRVEGRRIKFNKAFIARTWKKATMDKVCEALYNIEINNAFELVTLLLIVHVWPSSFQESDRLVLSLSLLFFSIFLSPSSSFLPQQERWFPAYLPSLPTFSSLFTAPQILVIRRERIQRAFKDVDIASSRQIVSSLLPPRRRGIFWSEYLFDRLTFHARW